ncbi:hypothetical protein [Harenicola maris]
MKTRWITASIAAAQTLDVTFPWERGIRAFRRRAASAKTQKVMRG